MESHKAKQNNWSLENESSKGKVGQIKLYIGKLKNQCSLCWKLYVRMEIIAQIEQILEAVGSV